MSPSNDSINSLSYQGKAILSYSQVVNKNDNHSHIPILAHSQESVLGENDEDEDEEDEFGGASYKKSSNRVNSDDNDESTANAIVEEEEEEEDEDEEEEEEEDEDEDKIIPSDIGCFPELNKGVTVGSVFVVPDEIEAARAFIFNNPTIAKCGVGVGKYLVDELTATVYVGESITIPLVVDTEFYTEYEMVKGYNQRTRKRLTTQVKGISKDALPMVYGQSPFVNVGRELAGLKPFPTATLDCHLLDYVRDRGGVDISIREGKPSELYNLPSLTLVTYAHFATAELNMIFEGTLKKKIKELQVATGNEQISAGRRIFCQTSGKGMIKGEKDFNHDWVSTGHIVNIEGFDYVLRIKIIDTGAIHGIAGYGDVAKAVGLNLAYKDLFTSDEKGRMLDMVIERALDFEKYAIGDLYVYEILELFDEKWQLVYAKLGISDFYRIPKLTIGGTVKQLFEASLAKFFNLSADKWVENLTEIVDKYVKPGSADTLRKMVNFTHCLLSKVEGGRCRNNRPTELRVISKRDKDGKYLNPIIDIDISGCYGEGQRNQEYPFGKPEIFDYKHSKNNHYISLREWLSDYGVKLDLLINSVTSRDAETWNNQDSWGELLSGLWQARITTVQPLKYQQNFFASWFLESSHATDMMAKALHKMKCDSELLTTEMVEFDEDMGNLKVFHNDIKNGVLTHDGLQWILAVASMRQRNEMLDSIKILSSAVYCFSDKIDVDDGVDGLKKLDEKYDSWTGKNTTQRIKNEDGTKSIIMNFKECHAWFSVNLGTLLVDALLVERKKAQIVDGKKSPLDTLFKLCVNTLYGDMVSKFFVTSNPVVGNNITARARALAWYMEVGLYGHQPITDGCAFEIGGVMFAGRDAVNGECINLHREDSKLSQRMIKRGSLGGAEITCEWDDGKVQLIVDGVKIENSMGWIDTMSMKHLQNIFSSVDVLHGITENLTVDKITLETVRIPRIGQFSFESKDIYHSGSFHGSANYLLENPNEQVIKARGYETKREHTGIEIDVEQDSIKFLKSPRYGAKNNPAKDMMRQLLVNPESVIRQIPAIKSGILKVGEYKAHPDKYDELKIEPGDNILKPVLMQEFSLSQFTFQSYDQYMSWKRIIEKMKMKKKQSLEGYFLNEDESLDMQAMSIWVDDAINAGVFDPFILLKNQYRNDTRTARTVKSQVGKSETRGRKMKTVVSVEHPHLATLEALKAELSNPPD